LKHPNICVLYDVGLYDGKDFLVMEYVEGITLAQRLAKGRLPVADALKIALEMADALDKAHRSGVVHRDLKPSNIMLTAEGTKLLDFGLAKARSEPSSAREAASTDPTDTETLTASGTILGTLQYMTPEQLEGQDADARTDIFAFGAVLYEMITGHRAFEGKSQAGLISAILSVNPPSPSRVVSGLPPALDHIILRCLAKNPAHRWHSARDLWLELETVRDRSNPLAAAVAKPNRRAWILSAVLAVMLLAALIPVVPYFRSPAPAAPEVRFEIAAKELTNGFQMSISPDGRRLAYAGFVGEASSGKTALWIRPLNSVEARMLPGTEGVYTAEWSPDGRYIVFSTYEGKLKKVEASGGSPKPLRALGGPGGGVAPSSTWNRKGTIIFANNTVLWRVSESGGKVSQVTELDKSLEELYHATPWFLPDGRHFVYTAWSNKPENRALYLGSLDSKNRVRLMAAASKVIYSTPGFLLYLRNHTLMAQPFDVDKLQITNGAMAIAEDVPGSAFYASSEGTLVYQRDIAQTTARRQWLGMDRGGKTISRIGASRNAPLVRLSPDGKRVAFSQAVAGAAEDLWVYDLDRDVRTRLTTDPDVDHMPIWSPDGLQLAFDSGRAPYPGHALYEKPSNGAGTEHLLFQPDPEMGYGPQDWSLDGRQIIFYQRKVQTTLGNEFWVLPLFGDRKPFLFLSSSFFLGNATLSPNGRWLAYVSNESGTFQVIVQPFPDPSRGKW